MKKIILSMFLCLNMSFANGVFDYLHSCSNQSYDKLKSMINDKNVNQKDKNGNTPLLLVTKNLPNCSYNQEVAKLLIDKGADIDARDKNGDTPLIAAMRLNKDKYFIKFLIKYGAEINVQSKKDGITPLIIEVKHKNEPMVKILLERYAKRGLKDKDGMSALDYAVKLKLSNIAQEVYTKKHNRFIFLRFQGKPLFIELNRRGFMVSDKNINKNEILFSYVNLKAFKNSFQKSGIKKRDLSVLAMLDDQDEYPKIIKVKSDISNRIVFLYPNGKFYKLLSRTLKWTTPPMFLLRDKSGKIIGSGLNKKFLQKIR